MESGYYPPMDWLTFIAAITKTLVWPGLLLTVLIMFRKGFATALPALASRLRSARWPGGELTFSEKLEVVEEKAVATTILNIEQPVPPVRGSQTGVIGPSELIEDAWGEFVEWVEVESERRGNDVANSPGGTAFLVGKLMAGRTRAEADKVLSLYRALGSLRQDVLQEPWNVSTEDAARFSRLLRSIRAYLTE